MKQIVILSGKGGTGKTSLAAAFAHLAHDRPSPLQAVLADADVDAANLELVLRPERLETHDFTGGLLAIIDPLLCQGCGTCEQVCRFDAVIPDLETYHIDPIACEGCAACVPVPGGSHPHGTADRRPVVPVREPLRPALPCGPETGP
jgi:MinD superfamily P-loop ATPase